jgi:L-lactate dehydrogenase complex protein LldE
VSFPAISRGMGDLKLDQILAVSPAALVSADAGCLMHLEGLAAREGRALPTRHLAQILRDALHAETPTAQPAPPSSAPVGVG